MLNVKGYLPRVQFHLTIGRYYLYKRNLPAARLHLIMANRLEPNDPAVRFYLGTLYLLQGKLVSARREYSFVLQKAPGHMGVRRGMSLIARIEQA